MFSSVKTYLVVISHRWETPKKHFFEANHRYGSISKPSEDMPHRWNTLKKHFFEANHRYGSISKPSEDVPHRCSCYMKPTKNLF